MKVKEGFTWLCSCFPQLDSPLPYFMKKENRGKRDNLGLVKRIHSASES